MARARRSGEEVKKLANDAKALIDGGMAKEAAVKQVGISPSVYARHIEGRTWKPKKGAKKKKGSKITVSKPGQRGRIDIRSLPPRPKGKKHGGKRQVNMDDIGSVGKRIATLDRRLRGINDLVNERIFLVAQLLKLLKKPKR